MNPLRLTFRYRSVAAVVLVLLPFYAAAAERGSVLGIPVTGAIDTRLGSGDAAAAAFSRDLAAAFRAALPPVRTAELEGVFGNVLRTTDAARSTFRLRAAQDVARFFRVTDAPKAIGPNLFQAGAVAFGFDGYTGVALYAVDRRGAAPLSYASASSVRPDIAREHAGLLGQLGIDEAQVALFQTVLLSTRGEEVKRPLPDDAPPLVYGVLSYASRALAGVQVEGSYAKVVSLGQGQVVAFEAAWPAIAFHPEWRSPTSRDARALEAAALPLVQRVAGRAAVNLTMAYVLRPVRLAGQRVFVPALKIGVLAQSQGVDPEIDGGRDLSELVDVYVDLAADRLTYDREDVMDDDSRAP